MQQMSFFEPKWATPPGATVLDLMRERNVPVGELAHAINKDPLSISRLLFGVEPLTLDWAEGLSDALGASSEFWLRREELYRADLKRLCDIATAVQAEEWLRELPTKDMVKFGWIEQGASAQEAALNACAFFGVSTTDAFQKKYKELQSNYAYRTSTKFEARPSAIAAWLRQGEIAAAAIDCANWSSEKLSASLADVRALTREKDPSVFLPKLERTLAECGVAAVVARAPDGCRASGATRFLTPDRAILQLSFRYLADDQFWFTVFHEIGHLLLHTHDELFLEGLDSRNKQAEDEADNFALNALFANVGVEALDLVDDSKFDIVRLARRAGIAPGIVVGQLQDRGRIPFRHFNYMKARYAWTS
jgi:HTH-type transcriptional regulator / antitoxin HigA